MKHLTLPNGLLGVLMTMAFVRGLNLLASSSGERTQSALDSTAPSPFFYITHTHQILNISFGIKTLLQK